MERETKIEQFVRNPVALFVHQAITFVAPFVFGIAAWVWVTAFNHYNAELDNNTRAIIELQNVVGSHNSEFVQEFEDHERRITRLEDSRDGVMRRSR